MNKSERLEILDMIEHGTITAEEGMRLLGALEPDSADEFLDDEPIPIEYQAFDDDDAETMASGIDMEDMRRWKQWWSIPLWVGMGIVVLSSFWMKNAWHGNALGFWFLCSWVPMLLGILMMALAWNSRTSPWLHVRVHQASGKSPSKVAVSFPLPLRVSAWGLRRFGHHIPNFDATGMDEAILALNTTQQDNAPLFIDVQDDEDGDHVQVFIG